MYLMAVDRAPGDDAFMASLFSDLVAKGRTRLAGAVLQRARQAVTAHDQARIPRQEAP
ncbi:hypothetical protein D3C85_1883120 [compost metagenome]